MTLGRSCFLRRLIVLACGAWAKVSQICIYKLFSYKTSSLDSTKDDTVKKGIHSQKSVCQKIYGGGGKKIYGAKMDLG